MTTATATRVDRVVRAGWSVDSASEVPGAVLVHRTPSGLAVFVRSSRGDAANGPDDCSLGIRLDDLGRATVVRAAAPPALWLTDRGVSLVPGAGRGVECVPLAPGERLLCCTADVFERCPAQVAATVRAGGFLARTDPTALLAWFLADSRGAAVCITRLPDTTNGDSVDHRASILL